MKTADNVQKCTIPDCKGDVGTFFKELNCQQAWLIFVFKRGRSWFLIWQRFFKQMFIHELTKKKENNWFYSRANSNVVDGHEKLRLSIFCPNPSHIPYQRTTSNTE